MKTTLIAIAAAFSFSALAQEPADTKSFEAPLPPQLTAPTVPGEPLPGPKVLPPGECQKYPEVCQARKEELRRKRQACHDNPKNCDDPALKSANKD
jgi:hypothetical protein